MVTSVHIKYILEYSSNVQAPVDTCMMDTKNEHKDGSHPDLIAWDVMTEELYWMMLG